MLGIITFQPKNAYKWLIQIDSSFSSLDKLVTCLSLKTKPVSSPTFYTRLRYNVNKIVSKRLKQN